MVNDFFEIERKFLVKALPDEAFNSPFMNIIQGYLNDNERVRILLHDYVDSQKIIDVNDIESAFYTIKTDTDSPQVRIECEERINPEQALKMLEECGSRFIRKIRYLVTFNDFEWEFDEFFGPLKGLFLAECEGDAEIINAPDFYIPSECVKEVTNDKEYRNSFLSLKNL